LSPRGGNLERRYPGHLIAFETRRFSQLPDDCPLGRSALQKRTPALTGPEAIRRLVELGLKANGTLERSMSLRVRRSMDTQTKREIWLLTLGTIIVEVPVAFAAFAVFTH